jgi:hypothetical protein
VPLQPIDLTSSWRASAAYLYALRLDRSALAWEYLRRNATYQSAWQCSRTGEWSDPAAWGLLALEDPRLNGLEAMPPWYPAINTTACLSTPDIPHLRTARFSLWALPGFKRITYVASCFEVTNRSSSKRVHLVLGSRWTDGDLAAYLLPLDVVGRVAESTHCLASFGSARLDSPAATAAASRAGATHMRMLQALDGAIAGASQRDIAMVLFGDRRASLDWSADSALRAQTRHAIRRARALMNGHYRRLLEAGRPKA